MNKKNNKELQQKMIKKHQILVVLATLLLTFYAMPTVSSPETEGYKEDFLNIEAEKKVNVIVLPIEFEARVTAYTAGKESTGKTPDHPLYGITASGVRVFHGALAAPKWIPFGTVIEVPGYGRGIVVDRGKAIRGNRLDVFFHDLDDAKEWGVKDLKVKIIKWGN